MARPGKPSPEQLGALIGPRLATVIVDALTDYSHKTVGHKAQIITSGLEGLLDLIGKELQPFIGPILKEAAEHPELPPHVSDLLHFAADHKGEAASFARSAVAYSGVGTSLGTVLSAYMAPAVHQLLERATTGLPDPATLAQAAAQDLYDLPTAQLLARKQNMGNEYTELLVHLAQNHGDLQSWNDLRNRGVIGEDVYLERLRRIGIAPDVLPYLTELRHTVLSPADAADMVVRGIIDKSEGEAVAAKTGMDAADFDRLVLDTGEPLALEQLLLLYRREHGIRQSRVRNEWIADAVKLRFAPPAGADAIRAAVQNQLPMAEAQRKFAEAGTDPAEFGWMFDTAGRPPGVQELISLWRKGFVGADVVAQAVRESDIKTKYVPTILKMFDYRPPPRSIVSLLRSGSISDAKAATLLAEEGLAPELVAEEIKSAHHVRTAATRHLAQSVILKLFHDKAISEAEALDMLEGIGWSKPDAGFILATENLHREAVNLDHAVNHIRSLYIAYHLDRSAAVAAMAQLGTPSEQSNQLFALWDLERTANAKQIPHGTITTALRYQIIDQPTAQTLLEAQGYSPYDAWVLISVALKGPQGTPPGGP